MVGYICGQDPVEVTQDDINDNFYGVTHVTFVESCAGHHLAILHYRGQHRIIQSNALNIGGNQPFSPQSFQNGVVPLHQGNTNIQAVVFQTMNTQQLHTWINQVRMIDTTQSYVDPTQVFSLCGVFVKPRRIEIRTYHHAM